MNDFHTKAIPSWTINKIMNIRSKNYYLNNLSRKKTVRVNNVIKQLVQTKCETCEEYVLRAYGINGQSWNLQLNLASYVSCVMSKHINYFEQIQVCSSFQEYISHRMLLATEHNSWTLLESNLYKNN